MNPIHSLEWCDSFIHNEWPNRYAVKNHPKCHPFIGQLETVMWYQRSITDVVEETLFILSDPGMRLYIHVDLSETSL
jgi:hypothetical protein